MLCIFCLEEKPARSGAGEHPIPLSVGGSWTIDRLCEDCDNKFRFTHDARLTEVTKIAERRELLKLAGHSGKVPNTLDKALERPVLVKDAPYHKMLVRRKSDGTLNAKTIPKVDFEITITEDERCFASIRSETFVIGMMPPEEAQDLIRRRLRVALEERDISFPEDVISAAAEKMFAEVEVFDRPITVEVHRTIKSAGFAASMFKAVYEAAWYWLGDTWLNDPQADRMRRHLGGDESITIRGKITEGPLRRINTTPTPADRAHAVYLMNGGNVLAIEVYLFDLFSIGAVVTESPELYVLPSTSAIIMDAAAGTLRELQSKQLFENG